MIKLLFTTNPRISNILLSNLELKEINIDSQWDFKVYRNASVILFESPASDKAFRSAMIFAFSEYNPDLYFYVWESLAVSTEINAWDIILPNVLFEYNPSINDTQISKDNRDSFSWMPIFIENYDLQNDYDFENFGLRVGWITVSSQEFDFKALEFDKLRLAYEADVVDDFSYFFIDEAKKMQILDKTYVVLWVVDKDEAIALDHISHIVNFLMENISWEYIKQDDSLEFNEDEDE